MSVSAELLDALKAALGGVSDYRLAKLLELNQVTVSNYRTGKAPMPIERAADACKMAGIPALPWVLRLQMERAKTEAERSVWNDALHRLAA